MAVTSIWPIKGRVEKVINYARNPEKTREETRKGLSTLHEIEGVIEYAADEMKTETRAYVTCLNLTSEELAAKEFMETKGDEKSIEETKARIAEISKEIKSCRKEIELCTVIAERSARVQENLEQLKQQETERKEKTTDEFLSFPGGLLHEAQPCRHIRLQDSSLRLSFCRRNRDNICNRNRLRYIRAIYSAHVLPYQIPIISFTSLSAIFTAPTKISILKINSPI